MPEIQHHCPSVPMILVGTKTDLRSDDKSMAVLKQQSQRPISCFEGINHPLLPSTKSCVVRNLVEILIE